MQHARPGNPTIVAVASPPGRSPRGLLRISGSDTGEVLKALVGEVPGATRALLPVRLRSPELPALLLRFTGPHSYTGEDAAELQVPGNAALLDRLLHDAMDACPGVRLAEPGEFTFRAYTAGKLDLMQAEGIAATIHATSDSQLRAATLLRQGKLSDAASRLVDDLGSLLALVEAGIDFTDQEDVVPIASAALLDRLENILAQLQHTLRHSRPWGAIEALPRVVLVGPPSAGKSTLFNALLGRERAVIDAMPGTTRDVLKEPLTLADAMGRPAEVLLVDIAGLEDGSQAAAGLIDAAAQRAAHDAIQRADLILQLRACHTPTAFDTPGPTPTLRVLTQCDRPAAAPLHADSGLRVSAMTGKGLDELRKQITQHIGEMAVSVSADMLALQPRHASGLKLAVAQVETARAILAAHPDPDTLPHIELLADAMRAALDALAALGGRLTPDEVIGRVFSTFCVGK